MDKPVIDDAAVERACRALYGYPGTPGSRENMRNVLLAALTPPPSEVEVPVSSAMIDAGALAWTHAGGFENRETTSSWSQFRDALRKVFVAMERQRQREAASGPEPGPSQRTWKHSRGGDGANRYHRRSTDPK